MGRDIVLQGRGSQELFSDSRKKLVRGIAVETSIFLNRLVTFADQGVDRSRHGLQVPT